MAFTSVLPRHRVSQVGRPEIKSDSRRPDIGALVTVGKDGRAAWCPPYRGGFAVEFIRLQHPGPSWERKSITRRVKPRRPAEPVPNGGWDPLPRGLPTRLVVGPGGHGAGLTRKGKNEPPKPAQKSAGRRAVRGLNGDNFTISSCLMFIQSNLKLDN